MKQRNTVMVSFRCPRSSVERFKKLLEAESLKPADVFRYYLRGFSKQEAHAYAYFLDRAGALESDLRANMAQTEAIKEELAQLKKGN